MLKSVELRQERANIWEQAQALLQAAEEEGRDFTAEERESWDKMNADMDALKGRIDRLERSESIDEEMESFRSKTGGEEDRGAGGEGDPEDPPAAAQYRSTFWDFARFGREALTTEQRQMLRGGFGQLDVGGAEQRALSTLTGSAGGYTVPDADMAPMTQAMIDWGGMRQARTRKFSTADGNDIPIPTVNDTGNIGRRISENAQVESKEMEFGGKVLRAYIYTSDLVLVPFAFLQDTSIDISAYLMGEFGVRLGRIQNSEDTTGSGDSMPEGLITEATVGKTTAASTAITYAELVDLEHSVYAVYRNGAQWMFADSTLKYLKKLLDGDNRPLWAAGISEKAPDTILGYPYVINADMAAIAATAKTIAFGDFSYYWIRDVSGVQVLRLEERYADYGQVGFLAFQRHDGKYVNAGTDPIKVLKQKA